MIPFAIVLGLAAATAAEAPVAAAQAALASDYVFRSDAGLLVFHVRPERASEFEAVVTRIRQGLDASTDPTRRQQRSGLRVFKSAESSTAAAVYVAVIDPVVAGADYDPVRMITELLPGESSALYERLRSAVVKVERVGLALLR